VVGHPSSVSLAERLSRPFGVISSVGVHTSPNFAIHPPTLYDKNLSLTFGRCPVRALLSASQAILSRRAAAFEGFVESVVGLEDEGIVKEVYTRFDRGECGKICFKPWS
jgi:threonine dehydrogenase-like Zn-dependent dehydrogenase